MNPEDNNNKTAPTTVGGVTFGGGQNNDSATPVNDTPQNQPNNVAPNPEPVDPIIESTGEEFDAIMNEANGEQPDNNPVQDNNSSSNNFENHQSSAQNLDFDQAPIPSNLSVPVSSPTHFDTQNTVRPIVKDPGIPMMNEMNQTTAPAKAQKSPNDPMRQIKKLSAMSVIFGILTAIFMVTTVVALVLFMSRESEYNTMKSERDTAKSIVSAFEKTTGVSPINSAADVPIYKATTGYIYISEWNIKIKIPSDLENVSYILNQNRYHPSICFNAIQKGVQLFPDFANVALNPGRMGCLTRVPASEGSFDAATGISFGIQVFSYKDYNYFYTDGIAYSKNEADLGLEHTAIQIIKNMLSGNNIEKYE